MAESLTLNKSKDFAIRIVNLTKHLRKEKQEFILTKQLLRSGTSIGANLSEAYYGISRNDFLAKVFIALKECAETKYWLELLHETDYLTDNEFNSIYDDCNELMKLLASIAKTTRKNESQLMKG